MSSVDTDARRFPEDVLRASGPVLVDFWKPSCQPCRALAPHVDRVAQKYEGRVRVVKLNIDQAPGFSAHYALLGVPALFLFSEGEVVDRIFGYAPDTVAKVESAIERLLASSPPISDSAALQQPWTPPPPPSLSGRSAVATPAFPTLPPIDQLIRRRNG